MKVGFVIYGDINTLSGGYLYDRKLVSFLEHQGDSVKIISLQQRTYLQSLIKNTDPQFLLREDIDIIVQDELIYPSIYRTNWKMKKLSNIPIISLVHLFSTFANQPFFKKFLYSLWERKYLKSLDGLILNSQSTLTQARTLLRSNLPPHIVAVPAGNNFLDENKIYRDKITNKDETNPLNILYAGNVIKQKGLDVIIRALSRLDLQYCQLTIAGRIDMEPDFVKNIHILISKFGLERNIFFTGPLHGEELIEIYQSNDVLVLPSINEAYGIVYIEAMSFGLPVIGTTAGGAKEIINHGENGFLISPNDSNKLSEHLSTLYNDRELLRKLSENAFHTYQQHPTWDDTCKVIRDFLLSQTKTRNSS